MNAWRLPEGWRAEWSSAGDQWMVFPPEGYGESFPVKGDRANFWLTLQRMVEQRVREVESR